MRFKDFFKDDYSINWEKIEKLEPFSRINYKLKKTKTACETMEHTLLEKGIDKGSDKWMIYMVASICHELWKADKQARLLFCNEDITKREKLCHILSHYNNMGANVEFSPYEVKNNKDNRLTINILCGFPGAGKTTYANNYLSDTAIISIDKIRCELKIGGSSIGNDKKRLGSENEEKRVYEIYYNKVIDCCKNNKSCTLDNLYLTKKSREELYSKIIKYNPFVRIIYIEAPRYIESCLKRRDKLHPPFIYKELNLNFDFPELGECNELIICKQHEDGNDKIYEISR